MFKNWSNRDWFWLTGILSTSIYGVITFRLSDNLEVINLFSFISSSISIALAIIAIYIALKQDRDSRAISKETSILLNTITGKIEGMDSKIDNLDPNKVTEPEKDQLIKDVVEILHKDAEESSTNSQLIEEITGKINEKFDDIDLKLQNYYDPKNNKNTELFNYKIIFKTIDRDDEKINEFILNFMNSLGLSTLSHKLNDENLELDFSTNIPINRKSVKFLGRRFDFSLLHIELTS